MSQKAADSWIDVAAFRGYESHARVRASRRSFADKAGQASADIANALFQQQFDRFASLALKKGSRHRASLLDKLQVEFRTEVDFRSVTWRSCFVVCERNPVFGCVGKGLL